MPIPAPTATTITTNVYIINAPQVIPDVPLHGNHKMYTTAGCRVQANWTPDPNNDHVGKLAAAPDANGNAYYLPYNDDKITSMRLPNVPPVGVNLFMTANMSGCKLFIDAIVGSNDMIIYHANTHQHGSAPHNTPVNAQSPQALAILDALHTTAVADYAAAPHNLVLHNVAQCAKVTYYGGGALLEQRKANQGKMLSLPPVNGVNPIVTPEFNGGCSIMGFYQANAWHFYYQAWGMMTYDRDISKKAIAKDLFTLHWNSLHRKRTRGTRDTIAESAMKVAGHGLIY